MKSVHYPHSGNEVIFFFFTLPILTLDSRDEEERRKRHGRGSGLQEGPQRVPSQPHQHLLCGHAAGIFHPSLTFFLATVNLTKRLRFSVSGR